VDLTQNASTTLTLSSGGLLRAGGGSTTISGGTIGAGSGVEYVFRTDTAADSLTVASVIGANGTLTGYAGGLERKRWLLAHEAASAA
jgi:methylated-DNA-[protein]-cysteine S-methyltransferase